MYAVVGSHPPPPLNLNLVHKILNTEVSKPNLSLLLQHYGKDIFQDSFLNNTVKTKLIQKSLVLLQLSPLKKYLLSFCWKVKYFYDKIILKVPALTETASCKFQSYADLLCQSKKSRRSYIAIIVDSLRKWCSGIVFIPPDPSPSADLNSTVTG